MNIYPYQKFRDVNRKLSHNRKFNLLHPPIRKKKLPFGRIFFRNRKKKLPVEAKRKRDGSSTVEVEEYIRKLR
jgi:hypothetical protein